MVYYIYYFKTNYAVPLLDKGLPQLLPFPSITNNNIYYLATKHATHTTKNSTQLDLDNRVAYIQIKLQTTPNTTKFQILRYPKNARLISTKRNFIPYSITKRKFYSQKEENRLKQKSKITNQRFGMSNRG